MAIIRLKELKEMSNEALDKKIIELKKELMKARTQILGKQVPDKLGRIKEMKKVIARIKTIKTIRGVKK